MDRNDICAHLQYPPKLTSDLVKGAKIYVDRHEALAATVPLGARIVEVGTMHGGLSRWMMTNLAPAETVVMDISPKAIEKCNALYASKIRAGRVRCLLGDSAKLLTELPVNHYDMIYVDEDHEYAGVCHDMEAARLKLKPGGLMVINDYFLFESAFLAKPFASDVQKGVPRFGVYGVIHSTNKFALRYGWKMAYLAMHHSNFPDVALRRPL